VATKKTRIDRRGKIRPLVKPFPPLGRMHWRKQKTLAMLNNRRQWQREFDPTETVGIEIEMEHLSGYYLVTESSTIEPAITWITTE
jgi:hypothetical protein